MESAQQLPYTISERRTLVGDALEAGAQTLRIPEVRSRLGRYAAELDHTLLNVIVPSIDRDGIMALDGYRRNSTPTIALHLGEFALRKPHNLQFNTIQRRQIRRSFDTPIAKAILEGHSSHCRTSDALDDTPIFEGDDIGAFVYAKNITMHNSQLRFFIRNQPVVALNIDTFNPTSPVNILHEFVHVTQVNRQPVSVSAFTDIRTVVRRELEAYYVSAQIIRGYQDAGRYDELLSHVSELDQAMILDIDTVRADHQPSSNLSFHMSEALIQELIDKNLQLIDGDLKTHLDMESSEQ